MCNHHGPSYRGWGRQWQGKEIWCVVSSEQRLLEFKCNQERSDCVLFKKLFNLFWRRIKSTHPTSQCSWKTWMRRLEWEESVSHFHFRYVKVCVGRTVLDSATSQAVACQSMEFSRGSSQPRDWTRVSRIAGRFFTIWATRKPLANFKVMYK